MQSAVRRHRCVLDGLARLRSTAAGRLRRVAVPALAALVAVATVAATRSGVRIYTVESASMEPTLHCSGGPGCGRLRSDRVLVERLDLSLRPPRAGDVVVVRIEDSRIRCAGNGVVIKRIVAVGGQHVRARNGSLYVDGRPRREPYVHPRARAGIAFPSVRIPRGEVFLLGDNRSRSCDSRRFGPVPRSAILGRVVFVLPSHLGVL
ncbi:MAG TPA: signal peptidase I [Gaiellaceae bacterium]